MKVPDLRQIFLLSILLGMIVVPVQSAAAGSWYPSSIAPYPGTNYRCDLKPLPHSLHGIPTTDAEFIDHAFSVVLKCTQEKELMLKAINDANPLGGFERYKTVIQSQLTRLDSLASPRGLEQFQADLIAALKLQLTFFDKAATASYNGAELKQIMALPEARDASNKLIEAWSIMESRYPGWDTQTKESLYHHVCALDLL